MRDVNEHRSQYRFSMETYQKLVSAANANGRSINAELAHRLALSFVHDEQVQLDYRIDKLAQVIQEQQRRDAALLQQMLTIILDSNLPNDKESSASLQKKLRLLLTAHFTLS